MGFADCNHKYMELFLSSLNLLKQKSEQTILTMKNNYKDNILDALTHTLILQMMECHDQKFGRS